MSNGFASSENLDAVGDIYRDLEFITDNIKISANGSLDYHELMGRRPWFDEECS
jgi:hypothetical protein